ncbi:agmatinase [Umboniibacter marinipuniceus]|uniref:Agmatinase n=1 Tax=Umboniibacter marinipuniceus TaxID=569599 RepID=A0A3M0ABF9_9GAMM|nr:agmatinase [Umboniibacter marinipuniceus]RMA82503.1 agmatinase [Umboniibacter marinipuniceus]
MSHSDDNTFLREDYSMFANQFSFMGFPLSRKLDASCDTVIMGVPYDLATSGRAGARSGPNAVRQASGNLKWEGYRWPWDFSVDEVLSPIDYGDVQFYFGDSEHMLSQVEEAAFKIVSAGKTLVSFGGDHFVTLPLLRGHAKHHGKLSLIHFDAHTDSYKEDERYSHGSMFYHAPNEGLIDPASSIQVGIRTSYHRAGHPFEVIDAHDANNSTVEDIVQRIKDRVGDNKVYLSFDIDCLDPAYAPGTGTPVVGGLSTNKILQVLQGLRDINLVGCDLVEVSPAYDQSEITALAGATIALQFLYMIASKAR